MGKYGGYKRRAGFYEDSSSYWGDDYTDSFYTSRFSSYKDKLFSWKKSENMVHPSVISDWSDNSIVTDITLQEVRMPIGDFIPDHIIGDVYRLMYHSEPQIVKLGEEDSEEKAVWFDLLSSLPIYGLAMQTNNSRFWSKVATQAIVESLLRSMAEQQGMSLEQMMGVGSEAKQHIQKDFKEGESGKSNSGERALRNGMKQSVAKAQSEMNKIAAFISQLGVDPSDLAQSAGSQEELMRFLDTRKNLINAFNFNAKKTIEFLKDTSKFFKSTTGRPKVVRDTLLGASSFHDIITPESLLFDFELPNVDVLSYKTSTKVNLYIDRSGSMTSTLPGTSTRHGEVRIIDAVSIFAYKLVRQGIVNKVFTFDSRVKEIKPGQVLFIQSGGGTSFTEVVRHYERNRKTGDKSLGFVLTDGCDDTSELNKDVSWMFIEGGPGQGMRNLYSDDSMRIWSDGKIKRISEWSG